MKLANPSKNDYHIGIITALPLERAAVTAMLDARFTKPDDFHQELHDPNSYTWGLIGSHNVVIASSATGVYGTTIATTTALPMLWSFPNLKFGLMVGIGAGVANIQDVRLGDVVVSQPSGMSNGVFQYDLGKANHNEWQRKDFLVRPPEVLLRALANLQAEHEFGVYQAHAYFRDAASRHEHWATSYGYPKAQDQLFQSSYLHRFALSNTDCSQCDQSQTVQRLQRQSPAQFQIHYGAVASGNSLIKDAELRDKIAAMDDQCICIEMEAAGLMNNFPCLVIRGISDYGDSHKNNAWQRYASATAAAFAKELLTFVPRMDPGRVAGAVDIVYGQEGSINPQSHNETISRKDPDEIAPENASIETASQFVNMPSTTIVTLSNVKKYSLIQAIKDKNLDHIRILLQQGADPDTICGEKNNTGLHIACRSSDYRMVDLLLDNGANIETRNSYESTPLHITANEGSSEIVISLLDRGADIEAKDDLGRTPLHWAAYNGKMEAAKLLIDYGASLNTADKNIGSMPLHLAVWQNQLQVAKLLIDYKADIEARNDLGKTPLYIATSGNNLHAMELLLDHGADTNAEDFEGLGPIHFAISKDHLDALKLLIDKKADINPVNYFCQTPLHIAILNGRKEVVELLLYAGADIEAKDKLARTPLLIASAKNKSYFGKILIARGAKIDVVDHNGDSPLHWAARNNNSEIANILLLAGSDLSLVNNKHETALDVAMNTRSMAVENMLVAYGADSFYGSSFSNGAS